MTRGRRILAHSQQSGRIGAISSSLRSRVASTSSALETENPRQPQPFNANKCARGASSHGPRALRNRARVPSKSIDPCPLAFCCSIASSASPIAARSRSFSASSPSIRSTSFGGFVIRNSRRSGRRSRRDRESKVPDNLYARIRVESVGRRAKPRTPSNISALTFSQSNDIRFDRWSLYVRGVFAGNVTRQPRNQVRVSKRSIWNSVVACYLPEPCCVHSSAAAWTCAHQAPRTVSFSRKPRAAGLW